jgi:Flp pilus assembly protein TadB
MEKYSHTSLQTSATRVMTISHLWVFCFTLFWAISGGSAGYAVGTSFRYSRSQQPAPTGLHVDPAAYQALFAMLGVVLAGGIAYLIAIYLTAFLKMIVQVALAVGQIESHLQTAQATTKKDRHAY